MPTMTLTIGNRNYSSWSLRAWLALEQGATDFVVDQIWLDEDRDRQQRRSRGPTGKVPVLRHGETVVWDSLAISEYVAELFPHAGLWPDDVAARAHARAIVAEMHAGFAAIRSAMPMNCRVTKDYVDRGVEVANETQRVLELWTDTRRRFGDGGPFLFGARSLADAFYAPVVSRFRTYGVKLDGAAAEYAAAVLGMPAMKQWFEDAAAEPHSLDEYDALP